MNEEQIRPDKLIDTTDCLEAVEVFRGWKNFLFVVTILCILLLQVCFWLIDTGCVKTKEKAETEPSAVSVEQKEEIEQAVKQVIIGPNEPIEEAAKQVAGQPSQSAEAVTQEEKPEIQFRPTIKQVSWLIRFFNFVLIPTIVLYCLTMMFGLKVSLLGRLGGINHITRAFFLSLLTLVLILPWQRFFGGVVVGAMFTPNELINRYSAYEQSGLFGSVFYYLRFTGYCLVVLLLLVFSYIRSVRWSKAVLRRLEVM